MILTRINNHVFFLSFFFFFLFHVKIIDYTINLNCETKVIIINNKKIFRFKLFLILILWQTWWSLFIYHLILLLIIFDKLRWWFHFGQRPSLFLADLFSVDHYFHKFTSPNSFKFIYLSILLLVIFDKLRWWFDFAQRSSLFLADLFWVEHYFHKFMSPNSLFKFASIGFLLYIYNKPSINQYKLWK